MNNLETAVSDVNGRDFVKWFQNRRKSVYMYVTQCGKNIKKKKNGSCANYD